MKVEFNKLYATNRLKALQLLNEQSLSFPCLYLLLPQINERNLFQRLSWKNQYASKICSDSKMPSKNNMSYYTLKWILVTSVQEENMNDDFDEIIDKSASQLLIIYKDRSILPMVADLIFKRNRKGKYIHDLTWCFFQSNQIKTMNLIAEHIRSEDACDRELSCKLLNFKPELQPNDKQLQFNNFSEWLNKNKGYIYSTGDSMQQTSSPKYWRVNLRSKYLCNNEPTRMQMSAKLSQEQQLIINEFDKLEHCEQKMLAKYSTMAYNINPLAWNNWIKSPIQTQINMAKAELGDVK